MLIVSVILFNGLTADETCFGYAPAPLLLLICIPRVCFLQHSLHHLIYILQYDIKIAHHHSKQHNHREERRTSYGEVNSGTQCSSIRI